MPSIFGIGIIEEQIDKWGPLKFIVVVNPKTGEVINAAMMKYVDGRARVLANRSFLKKLFAKGPDDSIEAGKDVDGISGATVSTRFLCFIVKKNSHLASSGLRQIDI